MATGRETEEWPLKRLLSDVVGSGPKSAEDMTREQATEAFERILRDDPDSTTLGAFWLANRWKKNTPTELAAYRDVMARESVTSVAPDCDPVDCGANYDGKGRTALLGVAAGLVAASAGTPVVVHSGGRVPSGNGVAYKHVLDELGVETDLAPAASAAMTDEVGFGFYYQPHFNPGVHDLLDRREQMGVRTFLNTVETLANPADADVHLGSFYHLSFAKKLTDTVAASETADFSRVLLFQGLEGYDDVRPGSTTVAEWDGATLADFTIETEAYGMAVENADLEVPDVAADSARITEEVLAGERTDDFADAVALNAALRLYAAEDVDDIEAGLDVARDAIETGAAADALVDLRAFEA
ncbi:anthranilate phosphoribosyltransferase [Halarchaeum salinum]|uniref:Anthranilate phosphoribosyltransferase n=1 Tax=Halarchaeum salinum TaxID=489912 RepID=A0AAV3S5Z8_9EURY